MPEVPSPPRTLSVLLVEDSPVIRHRLEAMLRTAPDLQVVGSAEAPAEALAEVERLAPDLLLLDLGLKGGSGLDVLRDLAPLPSPPAVVLLTAFATEEHRKRAYALGAVAVTLKFGEKKRPDAHVFRIENGKIRFIHTVTNCGEEVNCGFPPLSELRANGG